MDARLITLIVQRLVLSCFVFALVAMINFGLVELLPGDAATAYLGRNATPERVARLQAELGLDRPAPQRFAVWVGDLLRGDLGDSLGQRRPVNDLLWMRLRNSLLLAGAALLVSLPLALVLGVIAAVYRDRLPDVAITFFSLVSLSLPEFVVGIMLIFVFSLQLTLLPAVTTVQADAAIGVLLPSAILPIITMIIAITGYLLGIVRSSMIDTLASEYVQMARLRGISAGRVVLRHALPNALIPVITVSALLVAWMVGNLVVVEAVFNYPGIGTLMINAINDRDIPLMQAIVLVVSGVYILCNLLADIATFMLNPRLRTSTGG